MGKLVYISYLAYGHLNIGITLGNYLLDLYGDQHEIYFVVDELWYKRLQPANPRFKYKILKSCVKSESCELNNETNDRTNDLLNNVSKTNQTSTNDPINEMAQFVGSLGGMSSADKAIKAVPTFLKVSLAFQALEPEFDRILDEIQPNLILTDRCCVMPFVCRRNIPWVQVLSANPLLFEFEKLPPFRSGLGMNDHDKWVEYRKKVYAGTYEWWSCWNNWLLKGNCRPLDPGHFMYESPYFNIYCYPKELDYFQHEEVQPPGRWLQLESGVSPTFKVNKLKLPNEFEQLPGRLIYFSMGSLFSAYFPMMQRLLDILEQLHHKFIISKGCLGNKLRMPFNCWGEDFVDQKSVLNSGVDLVISHGGNNTVMECFHYGVPLIVLPVWGDQYDNGARLEETGLGRCLDAYKCTKQQLEKAIDSILNNEELIRRYKRASTRIQKDNGMQPIIDEIIHFLNISG